jgi:hypothetical protein
MKRRHDSRLWLGGGVLLALLISAVSWLVVIGPELASAAFLREQTAATSQKNDRLQREGDILEAKHTELAKYTSSLRTALAALPYDSGLPAFTRQLNAQAAANSVVLTSVMVGAVAPVTSATGSPKAVSDDLFSLQLTVQSNGTLSHQLGFLDAVRTAGPRRALVTATQVSPATGSRSTSLERATTFTTQLTVFSAPQGPAQVTELQKLLSGDLGS